VESIPTRAAIIADGFVVATRGEAGFVARSVCVGRFFVTLVFIEEKVHLRRDKGKSQEDQTQKSHPTELLKHVIQCRGEKTDWERKEFYG
jgi:hypothetical protein